jgi:nucleoside-diphosphate-sugar epimerase
MRHPIIEEDLEYIIQSDLPWGEFEGKTVLISGANGFLPAYLVETLLYLNETYHQVATQIIGLVRNVDKARARFAAYLNRSDLHFIVQDVRIPVMTDAPIDYIFHAASQASPKYFGSDPVGTLSANVLGTHNLLMLAQAKQTQGFLFFSSGEVYGQVPPEQIPISETAYGYLDPASVRACYAESKRMGETMCVAWAHQFDVPAKIVRPFHTYGPGMDLNDGRVFADFVANVVQNHNIVIKSDGSAIRPFCYLADATIGFFTVLLKGEAGQAYNIGNPNAEISILELAEMLVTLFPEKHLRVIRQPISSEASGYLPSPIVRNCPEITKVQKLGWQALTSVSAGFKRTIRSFS